MVFERIKPDGQFVAWGKEKAKENSLVIEAGEVLEGKIVFSHAMKDYTGSSNFVTGSTAGEATTYDAIMGY